MEENTIKVDDTLTLKKQQYMNHLKEIVMRQTDYSEEKALDKLKEHNNDITAIVREFMGNVKQPTTNINKSVNQTIYSEIRTFMDTASTAYRAKKEVEERQQLRQQLYIEQVKKEVERRKQVAAALDNTTTSDITTTSNIITTPTI